MTLNWDNAAEELVGKKVIVEIQHYDQAHNFQRYDHAWGVCTLADQQRGVHIKVQGQAFNGKMMILPPKLVSFTRPPQPGTYKVKGTGEEVQDPDWFVTWSLIEKPGAKATPGTGPRG